MTPVGKSGSVNTPPNMPATMEQETYKKSVASHLVALETELNEATREAGLLWRAFPYMAKGGNLGLVVTVYHPSFHIGMEETDSGIAFLLSGRNALEVATTKAGAIPQEAEAK